MKFSIYKKGQGYYTRLCTAFAGVGMVALGCYQLKESLSGWLPADMADTSKAWLSALISVSVFVGLSLFIYLVVNKPKSAEFMIETEGEMKKVNWPAKKEVISSTKVVIITVLAMAVLLGLIDFLFHWFFQVIGIITTKA